MKSLLLWLALYLATAFSLSSQISSNISLVSHWDDPTLVTPFGAPYNEVWGFVQGGREYAVLGAANGFYILDLDDPQNPVLADFIAGESDGVIHRDMHDFNGYLYMVADEGFSHLKIADLSYLPDSVHLVYDSDALIATAHNIFIDSAKAKLYAFGASTASGLPLIPPVQTFSLADPTSPTMLGGFSAPGYAHDGFVRNDTGYVNMWGEGLYMVDFSDAMNPVAIGQLPTYPGTIANHSGWLSPHEPIYLMADEWTGAEIKVVEVSDPSNLQLIGSFQSLANPDSVAPHNLMFDGRFAFISAYNDGLRIFDVSDPQNVQLKGFYDTYPGPDGDLFFGAWGVYSLLPSGLILVSDRQSGLYVFDVSVALGREENGAPGFEMWPVPTANALRIRPAAEWLGDVELRIWDAVGRFQHSEKAFPGREVELDLSGWGPGLYFVEIEDENGNRTVKQLTKR